MLSHFDTYSLKARIAPVFLTLCPLIIVVGLLAPRSYVLQISSGSILFSIALSVFGAQFSRDRGKIKEVELWRNWGGPPTTQFLRHSDTQFNPVRRSRIHKFLQTKLKDLQLPTPEKEQENPQYSDQVYEAYTRYLISKTRNSNQYPLILKENINYGFLRNLWGLKPFGITISLIGFIISVLYSRNEWLNSGRVSAESTVVVIFCLSFFATWLFWVSPKRIRVAAEAYAERLLEYCEQSDEIE